MDEEEKSKDPLADDDANTLALEQDVAEPNNEVLSRTQWRMSQTADVTDDALLGCLVVLCKLYGRPQSADSLRAGLPLQQNRFTPDLFIRAAGRARLSGRLMKRPLSDIHELVLPCVLLLSDNKSCVLVKMNEDNTADVIFPETGGGTSTIQVEELLKLYSGFALFVKPEYQFDTRSLQTHYKEEGKWFWGTIRKFSKIYLEVALAAFLINIFVIITPLFTMNVYDRVVPNHAMDTLYVLAGGVTIVYLFDLLLKNVRAYFVDLAGRGADTIIVSQLFERLLGMKLASKPASSGALASNLREFESLREMFTSATLITLVDIPFVILFTVVIFILAGPLGWIPTLAAPFVLLVSYYAQKPLKKAASDSFQGQSHKGSIMFEAIHGLDTIKRIGAEGHLQKTWETAVIHTSKAGMRSNTLGSMTMNFSSFVIQMTSVIMIIFGTHLIAEGKITMGGLIAAVMLGSRTLAPLMQLARLLNKVDQAVVSYKALDAFMNIPLERPVGKTFLHRPFLKGGIEFKNVKFVYPGRNNPSISGVSLRIQPGEKVGIIGQVGSGKSTLEKLISGLYEPTEGSILIDGNDSRQIDPVDLRRNIGIVNQDIFLFYGSIKDNITMGHADVNEQALTRAAYVGGVEDFIRSHPKGFDLDVGERGERLSGGQRQAIAIARALVLDPSVVILDEPTSAMDPGSANRFMQRFGEFAANKTVLIITHRNALLSLVNRVIVMDQGRIVADGPRDRVLEALQQGKIKSG